MRDVGAVPVVVAGVGARAEHVGAVDVVDEAVAVIVDAVARDLAGVRPDVRGEIGVVELHPAVEDRDDDLLAERLRPRDVHAERRVAQRPLLGEQRVARGERRRGAGEQQRQRRDEQREQPSARDGHTSWVGCPARARRVACPTMDGRSMAIAALDGCGACAARSERGVGGTAASGTTRTPSAAPGSGRGSENREIGRPDTLMSCEDISGRRPPATGLPRARGGHSDDRTSRAIAHATSSRAPVRGPRVQDEL